MRLSPSMVCCVWGLLFQLFSAGCSTSSSRADSGLDGGEDGTEQDTGSEEDADTVTTSDVDDDLSSDPDVESDRDTRTESDASTDTGDGADTLAGEDAGATDVDDAGADAGLDTEVDLDAGADTETDSATSSEEDTGLPQSELIVEISAPDNGVLIEGGNTVALRGKISDSYYEENLLTAVWRSDLAGVLGTANPDAGGNVVLAGMSLTLGWHVITLEVENPSQQKVIDAIMVGVCERPQAETFDENIEGWRLFGDAYYDSAGWLELTGTSQSKKGWIFKTSSTINPGDVSLGFSIRTGGGINSGADGFALSVFNVDTVAELESVIGSAGAGGCLGYGVTGGCGNPGNLDVEAFHIEIDTWHNSAGQGHPMTDPVTGNHIAITLNGNTDQHLLWHAVPSIEDNSWHELGVVISGSHVTMTLDNITIIDDEAPGLEFRGGYIGFSGSTGWATNWHSIDNLTVDQGCEVP